MRVTNLKLVDLVICIKCYKNFLPCHRYYRGLAYDTISMGDYWNAFNKCMITAPPLQFIPYYKPIISNKLITTIYCTAPWLIWLSTPVQILYLKSVDKFTQGLYEFGDTLLSINIYGHVSLMKETWYLNLTLIAYLLPMCYPTSKLNNNPISKPRPKCTIWMYHLKCHLHTWQLIDACVVLVLTKYNV